MRDAFGGTFIIKLLIIFIVVFVSFMAVALSYAKAFRVKNGVINILEQYQYDGTSSDDYVIEKVNDYLNSSAYAHGHSTKLSEECTNSGDNARFTSNGACIVPLGNSVDGMYYKVITYIPIEFNFFGLNFYIPISGETKIIFN